jgi:transcriptional regulator with XRE-family HTH domain
MQTLGELIRQLRESENWPQRKLAYELDIDVAVLSRIENENKFPKKRISEIMQKLSRLFSISEIELKKCYLSDEIASMLEYEEDYETILQASEKKVNYVRQKRVTQSKIIFDSNGSN